ncbi:OmpA family protein [Carboxylicivirga sp. A043]|uniref:OmpA family protein n=1 Tax=Carboxylicivirga litoralis TaxID=2816963 RepID=UPI0021CB1798|nr:OmpA family protein [Carboxylicivirga sp. A043]MCU4155601.1 OmpA family protein [Carboxylicivirga sp. A043]
MKQIISSTALAAFLLLVASVNAQVNDPKQVAKRQGTNRANNHIEEGVDKGFDKIEEGIGSLFGKKKKKKSTSSESNNTSANSTGSSANSVQGKDAEQLFAQHGIYPPEGATDVPLPVTLKWQAMNSSDFKAKGYELYLEEGETNPMKMIGGPGKGEFTCKNLLPNTTYSWKYVGQSSSGQYMPGGGGTFTTGDGTTAPATINVSWSKFDFVPGDEVIFTDGPDIMEENGEFPSRWDTDSGQTEIADVNGENVILFIDGNPRIMPYLKNAKEDYLPDVFTIEFDLYRAAGSNRFFCQLYDTKNQRANDNKEITIGYNYISCGDFEAKHPDLDYTWQDKSRWMHISIAFTKGKLKMYMDDVRLINIPRYEANPTGFTLNAYFANHGEGLGYFVKNVRIAKGGVKYYDRVMQDGKIICNGIRFDSNKATLKPESMGPINKICQLMQKQPDLKFSVEGHTDSDGDDNKNQSLSEQRAKVVMQQLVAMGISVDRLSSKGFGESQPLDNNTTPEGKANNRRVEFVRK